MHRQPRTAGPIARGERGLDRKHANGPEVRSQALEIIEIRRVHHVTPEGSGCHHGSIDEMRARQAQRS
jgi:hypothetical protein